MKHEPPIAEATHPSPGAASLQKSGPYPMGTMVILATVTMLFAAFTAAILVRRTGTDWVHETLPQIVWANTFVILLSSLALERARSSVKKGLSYSGSANWLAIAAVLGILFLVGQVLAWNALAGRGIFMPNSPHGAFFYMLSAIHGLHVLGGLGALVWTFGRTREGAYSPSSFSGLNHTAIYWHFVGVVWVYLLIILLTF